MSAARKIEMFKPGFDGERPSPQLTPLETEAYVRVAEPLIRRLHDAMLTLGALAAEGRSGGSSMPEYIHTFADKVGWDPAEGPPQVRFRPTSAQLDDFLPTMQLLDGLSPAFLKVLALRAVGEKVGGFSYRAIAERFGKGEAWAKRVHAAAVVLAARRTGLLDPAPKGWAVLVAAAEVGGWRTYLTTARDPQQALYDVRSKSPIELSVAFALWVAGPPEAKTLAQTARKNLLGRVSHGSWHMIPPEDMADLLIDHQTQRARPWELEHLALPAPKRTMKAAMRFLDTGAAE